MSKPQRDRTHENIHAATDPEQCDVMANRNAWKLKRVEPTNEPILKVNCVFYGEANQF